MALDAVVEHAAHPAQGVVGDAGGPTLHDDLQHVIDVPWLDVFDLHVSQRRADVLVDTAAHDVRVLPAAQNHPLVILIGQRLHGDGVPLGLHLRQSCCLALLLLAGHVIAQRHTCGQCAGRLAGLGQGQLGIGANLHGALLAIEAVAIAPDGHLVGLSIAQPQTIAIGLAFKACPGLHPCLDLYVSQLCHVAPRIVSTSPSPLWLQNQQKTELRIRVCPKLAAKKCRGYTFGYTLSMRFVATG